MPRSHHLAAELHQPAVGQRRLLDPPARAVARLQHHDVRPAGREIARGRQPREPRAQHHDVVAAHNASRQATSSRSGPRS